MDTKISEYFGSSRTEIKIQVCLTPKHMLFLVDPIAFHLWWWKHTCNEVSGMWLAHGFATPTCVNSGDHALRFSFILE